MDLSFVIPTYNEKGSLQQLHEELLGAIASSKYINLYEIVYVDDGSTDGSSKILDSFKNDDVSVLHTERNKGKSAALALGIRNAKHPVLVTLDSDLQDVPSELDKLLEKKLEGFSIVSGFKLDRKDSLPIIIISKAINKTLSFLYKLDIRDINSGFKVMDKEVFEDFHLVEGLHRYIPLIALYKGFTYSEVGVFHRSRVHGKSKYSVFKVIPSFVDLLLVFYITNQYTKLLLISLLPVAFLIILYGVSSFILDIFLLEQILKGSFVVFGLFLASILYLKRKKYNYEIAKNI